ncbi:MAG TPA: CHASE3 domain-containing protein [Steroidobacteraceae bacterium]|nr:CHASE3 domain-containing protein [Steroidobacteraceae bacterium]
MHNTSTLAATGNGNAADTARRWPTERKIKLGFAMAIVCLAGVGIASYSSVQHLRTAAGWVEHTHKVLSNLDRLLSLVTDAETAERGYVITGDEDYLASYTAASDATEQCERDLLELTADNSAQQLRLGQLNELVSQRLAAMHSVDTARRSQGFAAAQQLIAVGPGKRIHNELRLQIDEIANVERSLLRERQRGVDRSIVLAVRIGIGSSLLALACVAWAAWASRRDLLERKRIEGEREALRARLALQLEDMRRLHDLGSRLIVLQELPRMLEEILDATIELQHADFGNIQLYDPASESLQIVAQRGFSQAFLEHFRVVSADEPSACGRALKNRTRVIIEDVENDPDYAPHRLMAADAGFRGVQSTPIFGRHGNIRGVLSTHFRKPHRPSDRDVQMTDLYMRIAAELIERAQDAEAVRIARDEADRANRTKGRFLATASHDLRQPLQTLSLLNGTLRRLITDADAAQAAAQQELAITVMSDLLNALLDVSKLESGSVSPQVGNFELAELFEELRIEFAEPAARKGLRIEVAECHEFALSDRTLLGQLLRNLLGNAVRYTRAGCVRLQCQRVGAQLKIDVADTGIGIAKEHLRDIFEEFYQVGAPSNKVREGYGLGLSIVRRVAQLLDHELRVESELGKGSVFSVFVPTGVADPRTQSLGKGATSSPASNPQTHVLIVDDDLAVLDATRLLLKVEGYRVTTASSHDAAVEKARGNPDVELVVTDLHLDDGKLGTEVIRSVREALGHRVKVVLITGDTSTKAGDIAHDRDVRLMSKPIKADELLLILSTLTDDLRQAR